MGRLQVVSGVFSRLFEQLHVAFALDLELLEIGAEVLFCLLEKVARLARVLAKLEPVPALVLLHFLALEHGFQGAHPADDQVL